MAEDFLSQLKELRAQPSQTNVAFGDIGEGILHFLGGFSPQGSELARQRQEAQQRANIIDRLAQLPEAQALTPEQQAVGLEFAKQGNYNEIQQLLSSAGKAKLADDKGRALRQSSEEMLSAYRDQIPSAAQKMIKALIDSGQELSATNMITNFVKTGRAEDLADLNTRIGETKLDLVQVKPEAAPYDKVLAAARAGKLSEDSKDPLIAQAAEDLRAKGVNLEEPNAIAAFINNNISTLPFDWGKPKSSLTQIEQAIPGVLAPETTQAFQQAQALKQQQADLTSKRAQVKGIKPKKGGGELRRIDRATGRTAVYDLNKKFLRWE